ncbi:MAG: GGDEF domain-containing protein [Sulfuricella sp.]|nr:GGDEF domain-containing protein [Gammaproteobacteria bacterium]
MTLNAKILLFFSFLMGVVLLVLVAVGLYTLREFSLYTAERHARSVAETVKASLTESMVNGTISKRPQFLERLKDVPGVQGVRVIRAPAVDKQFGQGISLERSKDEGEAEVLEHGQPVFKTAEKNGSQVFRAIIPYIATDTGTPNCMQCHAGSQGTVLGAISIDIPLDDVKQQAITTVSLLGLFIFLTALFALFLLRRLLQPLVETANAVKDVVAQAVGGVFRGRIEPHTSDEVGEIASQLNRLMAFLDEGISTIGQRVGELMGHQNPNVCNQLVTATEMVEGLVEASHFKQAIEEDQSKLEVYQRLALVLGDKFDFLRFSIYEVASSKNRIVPIVVDGELNAPCRWCDQQILIDAGACRVRRTGHEVNAVDFPGICTMFRGEEKGEQCTHICLPITQSGSVGCVVQMVFPPDQGQFAKLMMPFIAVYLRETAPVLEAKRLMEHLRESSLRDAMTGLYNRRFLEEYVTTLVAISQRRKSPFSVLMLDLDYFKQVNDTFGHEAGDKVLKTLAETLVKSARSSDMVIRYGGEEFLIILMDTGAEDATKIAEKIRVKVEETKVTLPGTVLQKTISIGVSEFPADADTFWQVVKYADVALYEAKNKGRNRVIRFLPAMWQENEKY